MRARLRVPAHPHRNLSDDRRAGDSGAACKVNAHISLAVLHAQNVAARQAFQLGLCDRVELPGQQVARHTRQARASVAHADAAPARSGHLHRELQYCTDILPGPIDWGLVDVLSKHYR